MDFEDEFSTVLEQVPDSFFDRQRFVPAVGSLDADTVLVGEAPGADEVKQGEPFVGRAGQVLTDILEGLGKRRQEVYITNLVKIRPPDNRDPKQAEIQVWRPVLEEELSRVDPDTVVPMGNFASQELLDVETGISTIHGQPFQRNGVTVIPVYHPAATLYNRDLRPDLKEDLQKAFDGRNRQESLERFG